MKPIFKLTLIVFFLYAVNSSLLTVNSYSEIPKLINYQGRLTDSQGRPITGTRSIKFRLYDQLAGGTLLWEETQSVTIDKGIFNTLLGGVTSLNLSFDKPYYLELVIEGEVLSPRQQLASNAYAFRAKETDALPRGAIIMWSGSIASIPSGWALCDGTNGTPDLRDKFIKSVPNASTNPGTTGGSSTHIHEAGAYMSANHSHTFNTQSEGGQAALPRYFVYVKSNGLLGVSQDGGSNFVDLLMKTTQTGGGVPITGTSAPANSNPPYYELAFIMKIE